MATAGEGCFAQYIITAQRRLILALERSLAVPKAWAQFWPLLSEIAGLLLQGLTNQLSLCWIAPCSREVASSPAQGWPHLKPGCLQAPIPEERLCSDFNIFLPSGNQRKLVCLFVSRCSYLTTRAVWQRIYFVRNTAASLILFFCLWTANIFF